MRPTRLEMENFVSYRDPTVIEFDGTDLFALTGPTGAGKSTVIDAMTFALYGSVPRWDDRKLVAPAISQGAVDARVRLDFSVGGADYSAVRVVRRTPAGGGTVRDARLESGSKQLATSAPEVSRAVEELLGLTFEHFTRCVVLPQGRFADFLVAKNAERNDLLKRLLGLELFEEVRELARARASDADTTVKSRKALLTGEYADATPEALEEAAETAKRLNLLAKRVADAQPLVDPLDREIESLMRQAREAQGFADQLRVMEPPVELETVTAAYSTATAAIEKAKGELTRARDTTAAAEEHMHELRDKADVSGEVDKRHRRERLDEQRTQAQEDAEKAEAAAKTAKAHADDAATKAEEARSGLNELARTGAAAERRRDDAQQAGLLLAAVSPPRDLPDAVAALHNTREAVGAAAEAATVAAQRVDELDAELSAQPERAGLDRLLNDVRARDAGAKDLDKCSREHAELRAELSAAQQEYDELKDGCDALATQLETLRRANLAETLARDLKPGDDCPVCGQAVATAPAVHAATDLAAAEKRWNKADTARRKVEHALGQLTTKVGVKAVDEERLEKQLATLSKQVPADANAKELASELAAVQGLEDELDTARRKTESARRAQQQAEQEAETAKAVIDKLWTQLTATREKLATLDLPARPEELEGAWSAMMAWVAEQNEHQRTVAENAQQELNNLQERQTELNSLIEAAKAAGEKQARAAQAQSAAAQAHEVIVGQLAELDTELQGVADEAALTAELQRIEEAQQAAQSARDAERAADKAVESARKQLDAATTQRDALIEALRAMRDTVAVLKPPTVHGIDAQASWGSFVEWAQEQVIAQDRLADDLNQQTNSREEQRDRELERLSVLCDEHGIAAVSQSFQELQAAVQKHVADATQRRKTLKKQLESVANYRKEVEAANEAYQVANQLNQLLGARKFDLWYTNRALHRLIAGANQILADLSRGQYALHLNNKGVFEVIDHANASERRLARTLSGGETFLASLSLALALSEHVQDLAARGSARLESLFLDEGFGTLDPDTLSVVAQAIDELGARGRMVGIITHVEELAEHVPVRYQVSKNGRTSVIERLEA